MAKLRKLWKVTQGWHEGPDYDFRPDFIRHPESGAKVYSIYVPNNVRAARAATHLGQPHHDFSDVWVDERDGRGWQRYERIQHTEHPLWEG